MGHTSFQLDRRAFLKAGVSAAGALAIGPAFLRQAFALGPVTVGPGPYGPLQPFDANGIALPDGFTSREIARGGDLVNAGGLPYVWHPATDGQATFATLDSGGAPDGGWILVANSEMPVPLAGGVSGVEFAPNGTAERAYRVLLGTTSNCAGGPTPWGTWLSCEEHDLGMVHECDPTTLNVGVSRPAMGVFAHEAACVDPVRQRLYLTEDKGNGCLYRFTPTTYPDLSSGLLEVAVVDGSNNVTWAEVPDPGGGAANPTRTQVAAAAHFNGGEGTWYDDGIVYFTTKGDNRVWAYHVEPSTIEVLYDPSVVGPDAPLSGVDNITVSPSGDIFVCEDGRDHDICMITPGFEITRFLKLDPTIHAGPPDPSPLADNETVGVIFNPAGTKMYFGAQRSFGFITPDLPRGVVYEVSGPFRQTANGGGGGGGGNGGGAYGPALASAFSARLRSRKRRRIRKFLHKGLPIQLDLGGPAGVRAKLSVPTPKGPKVIGRAAPGVALNGLAALMVEPTAKAGAALRGRDNVKAKLEVNVADSSGTQSTLRRNLMLWRPG